MEDFKNNRDAAAWMIKQGRKLLASNVPICKFISRIDNNATFEMGFRLIQIGRDIAMGYQNYTREIYKAHVRATRKRKAPNV